MDVGAMSSITDLLSSLSPAESTPNNSVDLSSQQYFSEMLNSVDSLKSVEATKNAQRVLNEWTLGADLAAKTAGSFVQAVNKLVNIS